MDHVLRRIAQLSQVQWTVLALALLATACSSLVTPADTVGPVVTADATLVTTTIPETVRSATSSTSTSTTTTIAVTTTTLPLPHRLQLSAEPETATAVIETADGQVLSPDLPFDDYVVGPVKVSVEAEGYGRYTEVIELKTDRELSMWLDRPGQLLHKMSEWSTAGAPKQVAFTPDNTEVWVTLLSGIGFQVFDPLTGEQLSAVDLPEAGSVEVIFNKDGTKAYVSQMETASVYEIDVPSREVIRTLKTGGVWTKVMVLSPDEQTLWASNWVSSDVSEIDLVTGELLERIGTVITTRGLYVTPDGAKLYVAGFEDGEIQVVDLATRDAEVIYRSGGAMRHLVGDPETGVMYASDMARHQVLVVDTETNEVTELAKVDRVPNTIDLSPDGRVLYVSNRGRNNPETYYKPGPEWGTVLAIDTATGAYLDALIGGNQTTGLDVSPDGTMLAYSDFLDNRVSVYRIPTYDDLAAGEGGRYDAHLSEIAK